MDYKKVDIRNVVNELNILRRRVNKYMKIIENQNRLLKRAYNESITLNAGIAYYKKQAESGGKNEIQD